MGDALHFILADDHAIIRRGLRQILRDEFESCQIAEARDAKSVLSLIAEKEHDLLICDISMPGTTGLELCKKVRQAKPGLPVLILSMHAEEQYAVRALKAGASGYLTKESAPDELIKAVRSVLIGKKYVSSALAMIMANQIGNLDHGELHESLSDREMEVLKLIAVGKSLNYIAKSMHLSPNTISTYRSRILQKLNVNTNAALVRYAIEHRIK